MTAPTKEEIGAWLRKRMRSGDTCHFCGARHPGTHFTNEDGKRGWEGWEIKGSNGEHIRYLEDRPDRLCQCEGRR